MIVESLCVDKVFCSAFPLNRESYLVTVGSVDGSVLSLRLIRSSGKESSSLPVASGILETDKDLNYSCLWVKTTHSIPQSEVFLICILQIIHFCVLQAEDSSWQAAVWLIGVKSHLFPIPILSSAFKHRAFLSFHWSTSSLLYTFPLQHLCCGVFPSPRWVTAHTDALRIPEIMGYSQLTMLR